MQASNILVNISAIIFIFLMTLALLICIHVRTSTFLIPVSFPIGSTL